MCRLCRTNVDTGGAHFPTHTKMTIMNKKRYLLPAIVVHEIETQSVLQTMSLEKVEKSPSENTEDVDYSDKSKGFNINLWD